MSAIALSLTPAQTMLLRNVVNTVLRNNIDLANATEDKASVSYSTATARINALQGVRDKLETVLRDARYL